jgi:hypothetical protein
MLPTRARPRAKRAGREGKGREGKGREGKGREGKGRYFVWGIRTYDLRCVA